MMHPHASLKWIDDKIGYGVFATHFIPKGTFIYVQDPLDIVIPPNDARLRDPKVIPWISKYSYLDSRGNNIICWDLGKYMNHCCQPNTLSTGYGLEIAIKDIQPGEEITDDYAIFSDVDGMEMVCQKKNCRLLMDRDVFDSQVEQWDRLIQEALQASQNVMQPLRELFDEMTLSRLKAFYHNPVQYISVSQVKPVYRRA